jgi:hypothetical protein
MPNQLKRCPFCAEEIQAAAIVCKHWGRELGGPLAPRPTTQGRPRLSFGGFLAICVVFLLAIGAFKSGGSGTTEDSRAAAERAVEDSRAAAERAVEDSRAVAERAVADANKEADCRQDLQCWGDKHLIAAGVWCRDSIEKLAKYQAEWTDRWYEQKFSRFRWADRTKGTLGYTGDKVKFQNGFGAWSPMTYSCEFDPLAAKVLKVDASEGRI